jgi:hypothetical protein
LTANLVVLLGAGLILYIGVNLSDKNKPEPTSRMARQSADRKSKDRSRADVEPEDNSDPVASDRPGKNQAPGDQDQENRKPKAPALPIPEQEPDPEIPLPRRGTPDRPQPKQDQEPNPEPGPADEQAATPLNRLIRDLRSKDRPTRIRAANRLGQMGEAAKPAARVLCSVATQDSEELRQAVLEALEKIQPALVKPLTTLLVDQNVYNCQQAAQQLALMGGPASPAIPVLIWHARNAPTRFNAYPGVGMIATDIGALAKIGGTDPTAVRAIIGHALSPVSKDPTGFRGPLPGQGAASQERHAAVRALGELTHLENKGSLRKEVVDCLIKILVDCQEEGLYHSSGLTIPAIQSLSQYGADAKAAIPLLKKLKLHDDMQIRESATAALEKIERHLR